VAVNILERFQPGQPLAGLNQMSEDFYPTADVHEAPDLRDGPEPPELFTRHTVKSASSGGGKPSIVCSCAFRSESSSLRQAILEHELHVRNAMALQLTHRIQEVKSISVDSDAVQRASTAIVIQFVKELGYDPNGLLQSGHRRMRE